MQNFLDAEVKALDVNEVLYLILDLFFMSLPHQLPVIQMRVHHPKLMYHHGRIAATPKSTDCNFL
jgi:hypothetical protein